jgi:pinin
MASELEALKRELHALKGEQHDLHQRKSANRHPRGGPHGDRGSGGGRFQIGPNREDRDDRRAGKRQRTSLDGDGDVNGDGGAPAPPGAYASAPSVDTRPKDAPGIAKDEGEKRRGRRMLAGLLGTLKRHRDEEKAVAAVTAQRRSVIEQAETKAREVSEKLRQESFASNALRRARDHRRTAEIDLRVAEKELEVKRAARLEKDAKTAGCARTSKECGRPRVFYRPKAHTKDTEAAVEVTAKEVAEEFDKTIANSEEKVERLKRALQEATRELEEAEANAPEGDGNDDDEGNDANDANGRAPIDDDDDDKPEEGEVNGEVERSDGDEDMGDLEEGPDPEGLEDMLAGK